MDNSKVSVLIGAASIAIIPVYLLVPYFANDLKGMSELTVMGGVVAIVQGYSSLQWGNRGWSIAGILLGLLACLLGGFLLFVSLID